MNNNTRGWPVASSKETSTGDAVQYARARKHEKKILGRISRAGKTGKQKKAVALIVEYLRSDDAKYVAAVEANRGLKKHLRQNGSAVRHTAGSSDPWHRSQERAFLHVQPKNSKPFDCRPVLEFGLQNRTLQTLANKALKAASLLHPWQYGTRGTHLALARVRHLLTEGYEWAIETDISDCYTSFDGDKIPGLVPLPKKVSENILVSANYALAPGNLHTLYGPPDPDEDPDEYLSSISELVDAQLGIPAGSIASPILVEVLFAPIFFQLAKLSGVAVGYSDNTLTLGKTKEEVSSMTTSLWSALEGHPAGRFRPYPKFYRPGDPIEFLGHQFRVKNGSVFIQPTQRNVAKFHHELGRRIAAIMNPSTSPKRRATAAQTAQRYAESWGAAFKLCDDAQEMRGDALHRIKMAKKYI